MRKRLLILFLVVAASGGAAWAGFHLGTFKWHNPLANSSNSHHTTNSISWEEAVEKVKAERPETATTALEIPPELKHYEDRHWFLATQVAEVGRHNVPTCHDFVDLAEMIQRGKLVPMPAANETYVLYGVGQRADDEPLSRYYEPPIVADMTGGAKQAPASPDAPINRGINIELYSEAQLTHAYKSFDDKRSRLQADIEALKTELRALKKTEREKQKELHRQILNWQQDLKALDEQKARLDQFYAATRSRESAPSREQLFRDYETLQTLARNFGGRYYNLDDPSTREAFKVHLLSSLRPEALKILEEVAFAYRQRFDRPLHVSSLVRPEQYQHALRRVNRNAVTIETPPHTTGLAFDIDYRYMTVAEQNFVMAYLARLKREGRIEVIRERNANYHVFAFLNGTRPSDDLIAASLEKAGAPEQENRGERSEVGGQKSEVRNKRSGEGAKVNRKEQRAKGGTAKAKGSKRR
jgi:hypothetical protein